MTVTWLRVVLKNITSPPIHQSINPILLFMSGNIEWSLVKDSQPHIFQIVCSFSFIFLWRAIHNLHLWHRIHHVSHHILSPRDSNCWICDIIKHPVVSSLYTSLCHPALSPFPFDPLTSICSALPIAPTRTHMPSSARCMPPKVSRSLISLPLPPLTSSPYPSPSTHPPHANTTAAIDGRIMNCSWRLWGARETKGFLLSCVPFLPPFVHF